MIYFCTSLYCEAYPLISALHLKKNLSHTKFQVFENTDYTILVTNPGMLNSAIGITYLLSSVCPSSSDFFINLGTCGAFNANLDIGEIFLCNRIREHCTERYFYPDILFSHPFQETGIETYPRIVTKKESDPLEELVDMEASAAYQAASRFFSPHQLFFLKIISDHLEGVLLEKEKIQGLINSHLNILLTFTKNLKKLSIKKEILSKEEYRLLEYASDQLYFSCAMKNQFRQLLLYHKLQYGGFTEIVQRFLKENQCNSKREGKKYFEQLKQLLI